MDTKKNLYLTYANECHIQNIRHSSRNMSPKSSVSQSTDEKVRDIKYEKFLQNSSVYAVTQVGQSETPWRKILWTLGLTAALIGCCYKMYMFMELFFHYPIVVNLSIEQRTKAEFPAVTVCNTNRMKSEYEPCLERDNYLSKCILIKVPGMGHGTGPLFLPERRNLLSCETYFNGRQHKNIIHEIGFLERYSKLPMGYRMHFGYQQNELIRNCSFNGRLCEPSDFAMLTNDRYGNCYTFNKITVFRENTLMTSDVGSRSGLELVLGTNPNHSVPVSHTVGFRVVIHNPLDHPNPEKNGINIFPGYETQVSLKATVMKRLPAPYKDECVNYGGQERPFEGSQTFCMKACIQKYNHEKCGCIELMFRGMESWKLCNMTNSTDVCCLDNVMNDLATHGTDCNCPLPCQSTYFHEQQAFASWPSRAYFFKKNITTEDMFDTYKLSHSKVRIFFSTLERIVLEQQPMFLQSEIFSHLGGELGLWLGLSLVVLFELIEIIIHFGSLLLLNLKKNTIELHYKLFNKHQSELYVVK